MVLSSIVIGRMVDRMLLSLRWFGTLQAMFLLLTLFWASTVPQAAPFDYVGVRLPIHLLVVYLLGAYYGGSGGSSHNTMNATADVAYLKTAGRWLMALLGTALLVDIFYSAFILVPVFVAQQADTPLTEHARLLGTLFLTLLTFGIGLVLAYLLMRIHNILSAASPIVTHATTTTANRAQHHLAGFRPIYE
jgi:hypothetical protein